MRTAVLPALLCVACGRFAFDSSSDGGDGSSGVYLVVAHVNDSCAILDGVLSCWGLNAHGQLATGDTTNSAAPVRIDNNRDWTAVACGQDHTCGVRAGGRLYCWGGNTHGQLGVGDFMDRTAPTLVDLPRPVVEIDAWFHTCATLDDRELWCWGINNEGELGQNDSVGTPDKPSPVQVLGPGATWASASTGQGHTLALFGMNAWGTGRNSEAELGLGPAAQGQLRRMTLIDSGPWLQLSAGQNASCGVRSDGSAACWGANDYGDLGTGDLNGRDVPTTIAAGGTMLRSVDIDTFHACWLSAANTVSCWGRNVEGQLGIGDTTDRNLPTLSSTFDDWSLISVGRFHTCGMRSDHSVWCVGQNTYGQAGNPDGLNHSSWERVL
jgi:alpha-tubulin suppressor-like RCC1 family protein